MSENQNEQKRASVDSGYFCIHGDDNSVVYDIPINACTDRDDILLWMRQLAEKQWATKQVMADFVETMIGHFGVEG